MGTQKEFELRVLRNHISNMTKTYRSRKQNFEIVRDILMRGTSTAGMTSCIAKCRELGIDPYAYILESEVK